MWRDCLINHNKINFMARRKKRKSGTRRRRVGALALNPNSMMVQLGAVGLGFVMANTINSAIDKVAGSMDGKIVAAAQVGLGGMLVFSKMTGKKSLLGVVGGGILAGAGIKRALGEFGVVNGIGGYQNVPVIGRHSMNGYGKVPVISGYRAGGQLNGYPVPRPMHTNIVGSTGSGLSNDGSGYMNN
jgi:hypothetical protein